ncbi:MAG TPA: prolyl oligopeptidase family serine peptidase [Verrucomicrobiae bacterium]|jgi:predicted peptidase
MHKTFTAALVFTIAFVGCATISESDKETANNEVPKAAMQIPQHFNKQITRAVKLGYQFYLPAGYKSSGEKWPLLMFLHGVGERGTNLTKITVHGPPKLLKRGTNLPFIVVSPQCPDPVTWQDDDLLALLDTIIAKYNVDTNRVYLTGLSMGGYGTWSLGSKAPERFAAIAPVCGGGDQIRILLASKETKMALATMGVWAFHGAKDNVVPLEESQRMTNALMRAGCKDVKLTVYPEAGHDSWTKAYSEPELWDWFLAHKRGK